MCNAAVRWLTVNMENTPASIPLFMEEMLNWMELYCVETNLECNVTRWLYQPLINKWLWVSKLMELCFERNIVTYDLLYMFYIKGIGYTN